MRITVRITTNSFQTLEKQLSEISDIRADLMKKYPDIVVNVEVEVK